MRARPTVLGIVVTAAILLASCTGSDGDSSPEPGTETGSPSSTKDAAMVVTDYDSFTDVLGSAGHTIRVAGRTGLEDIFGVRGRAMTIDGVRVMAFEYPTRFAFVELRTSVSKDAYMVGSAIIDWTRPHLYGAGTLIAVYLGNQAVMTRTLEQLLGPQFAPR